MALSPQEALKAAKSLWPGITYLERVTADRAHACYSDSCRVHDMIYTDWPDDWTRYPAKEEWVPASMPEDWGKEARFSDDGVSWIDGIIAGHVTHRSARYTWWSGSQVYRYCQVKKITT